MCTSRGDHFLILAHIASSNACIIKYSTTEHSIAALPSPAQSIRVHYSRVQHSKAEHRTAQQVIPTGKIARGKKLRCTRLQINSCRNIHVTFTHLLDDGGLEGLLGLDRLHQHSVSALLDLQQQLTSSPSQQAREKRHKYRHCKIVLLTLALAATGLYLSCGYTPNNKFSSNRSITRRLQT